MCGTVESFEREGVGTVGGATFERVREEQSEHRREGGKGERR